MAKKANDLTGKEWLQNSFSIWRDLKKTKKKKKMNHDEVTLRTVIGLLVF